MRALISTAPLVRSQTAKSCKLQFVGEFHMAGQYPNPPPLHPPPLLQIPPRPPPPLAPPALNLVVPQPLPQLPPQQQPVGHQPPPAPVVRPPVPVPVPPPDPNAEGNIGVLLDPNWFRVVIMKCTASVHEGTASVTLDSWRGTWSFLPNEFVESALHASSGLHIKHFILKHHHLTRLPVNFAAQQTGLPLSLSTLDLSHNHFTSVPTVVCELLELKDLHFNHNQITFLPEQISKLTKLQTLNLQMNQLQTLPACICFLSSLRSLNAEDNGIKEVSSEIHRLKQLRTLHLKCNKIHHLPLSITKLPNLEELHLSNNRLEDIHLGGFQALRQLHLANNNLRFLPFSLVEMDLQGFTVSNNPLKFPPMSACRKGLQGLKSYMLDKCCNSEGTFVWDNPYYDSDGDNVTDD